MARIYLVEDEAIIRLYIEAFLKKHHELVGSTGSSDQALIEIPEVRPDIVVSDVMLLGSTKDGFSLAEEVNTKGYFPFIFLTAMLFPKSDERLHKIPIYGYISKPVDEIRLINTIELALWRITSEKQLDMFTSRLTEEIDKRKVVEKELRLALHQYEDFLNQVSDVVFDVDGEGDILYVNRAIENFLGYSAEELKMFHILDIVTEESLLFSRHLLEILRKDIIQQKSFPERVFEVSFQHKNGGIRWGKVSVVPLLTDSGILLGVRGIVHDISKEKNQQHRLELQLTHLQQEKYFQTIIRYVLERMNQEVDPYPVLPKMIDFVRSSLRIDGILLFRCQGDEKKPQLRREMCFCYERHSCEQLLQIDLSEDESEALHKMILWRKRDHVPERFRFYWDGENIKLMILFPLIFQQKMFGVLGVFWQTKRSMTRSFFTTMQIFAYILAQALRRHDDWNMFLNTQKQKMEQRLLMEKVEDELNFEQMIRAISHEVKQPL